MFNGTEVVGNKVHRGDVFVSADRGTLTFGRVTGTRRSGDTVNVVVVNDTVDGTGPVSVGDVSLMSIAKDDTVSVVR